MPDDIQIINQSDPSYPNQLLDMPEPPPQLYLRGNPDILRSPYLLAVVGSRRASHYGKKCGEYLLTRPVRAGLVLISGLAYGIDALAHRICVENMRPTVAVLGSGLDNASIYPRLNLKLARDILDNGGAIISEHPPKTPALPRHFPARNRIIAGLARTTLVLQAARKSGSLITARLAIEAGRNVWAVPGDLFDPLAAGTNYLLQQGALPIIDPQDIIDLCQLNTKQESAPALTFLTPSQQAIYKVLTKKPAHIDDLAEKLSLPAAAISITLTELELLEAVQNTGSQRYIKK